MADDRVRGIQQLWTDGDYARVGAGFRVVAERLVEQLAPRGLQVLDAATGTGNLAIAAARAGAEVDAFDLTPALLDQARERAAEEGVTVRFREGDLVDVPYPDASFDLVVSTFGAFLADDQERCTAELTRVVRPGGRVVATAWAASSMFVQMVGVVHDRWPDIVPDASPSPWADADRLAALTAALPVTVHVEERDLRLSFPSVDGALAFYEETSGPVQRLRAALEGVGDWAASRAAVADHLAGLAVGDGDVVHLPATYTVATLTRQQA